MSVSFSPDGQQLASASRNGILMLWDVNLRSWLKKACQRANRNLTQAEWQYYLGNRPYQKTCEQYPSGMALAEVAAGEDLAQQGDIPAAIAAFKKALAQEPLLTFDPQTQAKLIAVQSQLKQAKQLAEEDKLPEVIAALQQAKQWDETLNFNPETQAKQLVVRFNLDQGEKQARFNNISLAIKHFQRALELDNKLNFNPETKAKQILAQAKLAKGEQQARNNDIPAAIASFKQATELDDNLNLNPQLKAKQLAAQAQYSTAVQLARAGKHQEAVAAFQTALEFDTTLNFDPEIRAQAIEAVARGEQPAKQGKILSTLASYQTAAVNWEIPAYAWERLCRWGSLRGQADLVKAACDQAVTLEPNQPHFHDSRGLARALTGDTQGAIEDFQFYIDHLFWKYGQQQRQAWIEQLNNGKNPFTAKVLKTLIQELK
jgi:tetratricopeptide (TPR) repeat protein